jgi:hypothetical protein
MFKNVVFRIIAGLVLLAAIAGIAFFAYQAGAAHATVTNLQLPAGATGVLPYPYYGIHPFFGFGFFGVLVVFFLLMVAMASLRRMVWGPRWGRRHMGHGPMGHHGPEGYGPMAHRPWGEGIPPMFAEWHRRAHEQPADKKPEE